MPFNNRREFLIAHARATTSSLTEEYKGCTVYVNAIVSKVNGIPQITGYAISDWYSSESTVAQFRNGREV